MYMQSIQPLWGEMPLQPIRTASTETRTGGASFTDIFSEAVNAVRETDQEKTGLEYLMATGQLDNPSQLVIALSKAELSVNLLVKLRDRALEAYNELTRISL